KRVNDAYGHLVGDKVLVRVASAARRMLRDGDILVRYGGEEFMILLPGASLEDTHEIAERIRYAIQDTHVHEGEQILHVTISAGITALSGDLTLTAEDLIRQADAHLYIAKESGRNRVVICQT
ncbi:MAG: GGDEF domain-containing protein, partial [Acidobacteriaceae bacterium]